MYFNVSGEVLTATHFINSISSFHSSTGRSSLHQFHLPSSSIVTTHDHCYTEETSTGETSTGLGDKDQYQVRRHDDDLEQTADSQERATEIAAPEAAPAKPSTSSKKKAPGQEFVLLSSSDGPSGSPNHVSSIKISNLCFMRFTISSPRG
jgi:hypothetical protein